MKKGKERKTSTEKATGRKKVEWIDIRFHVYVIQLIEIFGYYVLVKS